MLLFVEEGEHPAHTGLEKARVPCRALGVQMGAPWQAACLAHGVAAVPKLSSVDRVLESVSFCHMYSQCFSS